MVESGDNYMLVQMMNSVRNGVNQMIRLLSKQKKTFVDPYFDLDVR